MNQEKQVPKEELMQREISNLRSMSSNANITIQHLSGEIVFWKKLALHSLGLEEDKINKLVQFGGIGLGSISSSSLSRGY